MTREQCHKGLVITGDAQDRAGHGLLGLGRRDGRGEAIPGVLDVKEIIGIEPLHLVPAHHKDIPDVHLLAGVLRSHGRVDSQIDKAQLDVRALLGVLSDHLVGLPVIGVAPGKSGFIRQHNDLHILGEGPEILH